jgi:hypothetical protein
MFGMQDIHLFNDPFLIVLFNLKYQTLYALIYILCEFFKEILSGIRIFYIKKNNLAFCARHLSCFITFSFSTK